MDSVIELLYNCVFVCMPFCLCAFVFIVIFALRCELGEREKEKGRYDFDRTMCNARPATWISYKRKEEKTAY